MLLDDVGTLLKFAPAVSPVFTLFWGIRGDMFHHVKVLSR